MCRSRLAPALGIGLGVVMFIAGVVTVAQQPPRGGGPPAPGARGQGAPAPASGARRSAWRAMRFGAGPWVFDTAERHQED